MADGIVEVRAGVKSADARVALMRPTHTRNGRADTASRIRRELLLREPYGPLVDSPAG